MADTQTQTSQDIKKTPAPAKGNKVVESKFPSLHHIAIPDRVARPETTPGQMPQPPQHKTITLLPGLNLVDAEDWAACTVNGMVQTHIKKTRQLVPLADNYADLTSADEDEAVDRVTRTVSQVLLKTWHRDERRLPVRDAIEAQLRKTDARNKDDQE